MPHTAAHAMVNTRSTRNRSSSQHQLIVFAVWCRPTMMSSTHTGHLGRDRVSSAPTTGTPLCRLVRKGDAVKRVIFFAPAPCRHLRCRSTIPGSAARDSDARVQLQLPAPGGCRRANVQVRLQLGALSSRLASEVADRRQSARVYSSTAGVTARFHVMQIPATVCSMADRASSNCNNWSDAPENQAACYRAGERNHRIPFQNAGSICTGFLTRCLARHGARR